MPSQGARRAQVLLRVQHGALQGALAGPTVCSQHRQGVDIMTKRSVGFLQSDTSAEAAGDVLAQHTGYA